MEFSYQGVALRWYKSLFQSFGDLFVSVNPVLRRKTGLPWAGILRAFSALEGNQNMVNPTGELQKKVFLIEYISANDVLFMYDIHRDICFHQSDYIFNLR